MAENERVRHKHIILEGTATSEKFTPPSIPVPPKVLPQPDRQAHGQSLLGQLDAIKPDFVEARQAQEDAGIDEGFGLRVEFESFPDIDLAFESLARERSGIEILNVRHDEHNTYATIFVPDGKLSHFENLLEDYLEDKRSSNGRSLDHKGLINTITSIRTATLRALWTDTSETFPQNEHEVFWWEVWLRVKDNRLVVVDSFRRLAELQGFQLAPGVLEFPERTVLMLKASSSELLSSIHILSSIAELRRSKETAEFFDLLTPPEQREWANDLLGRTTFEDVVANVPYVCLLDTGINRGHPLISPALDAGDMHTVEPGWGVDDEDGHGTGLAGLALFGNMTDCLSSQALQYIGHRLESVKLLPNDGANGDDPIHHGYLTVEAVSRPLVNAPNRKRVFSMAVTARDNRDRGRPSAWSATLDRIAFDSEDFGNTPKLFVVSAGNISSNDAWSNYPHSNSSDSIHDPAQAWNTLTVGAFTNLVSITEQDTDGYEPVAAIGALSPFSTTSCTWEKHWPFKPDVVFEGGNVGQSGGAPMTMNSLSLLTTNSLPANRLFTTMQATSAATALAAKMASMVMKEYPQLWPETVRGIMVHSARWTENMLNMYVPTMYRAPKKDWVNLIRHCGFGVPDINNALWSLSNSLTLIAQESLQPFIKEDRADPKLQDMNLHDLPWPLDELENLGNTSVEMRVTLSYYIEPNPSERGIRSRYRYESHGLKFEVKRSTESLIQFRTRINQAARTAEEGTTAGGSDPDWIIGFKNRHRGSLHSDIWRGTAADLASRGVIAVYPSLGWWKTRKKLERYNNTVRYSLLVSIHAPGVETDLYAAIENYVAVAVPI